VSDFARRRLPAVLLHRLESGAKASVAMRQALPALDRLLEEQAQCPPGASAADLEAAQAHAAERARRVGNM
jgi:hypothetical protein